jgi:mono/diheme cytochrome c family protein
MVLLSASLAIVARGLAISHEGRQKSSFLWICAGRRIAPAFDPVFAKEFAMIRSLALVPVIALLGAVPLLRQDSSTAKPVAFSVPADVAAQTNPVHPTAAGLALARKMYGYDCAMCHGKVGGGDGDMASSLNTKVKDYRDPASLQGMTDGDLFYIIGKGKGEMPGESDRAKPEQIWTMVALVRSFGKK